MKFTPAKYILDHAIKNGTLKKGGHVLESSSGTFALALAILCSSYGLKLTLITGPASPILKWRLENLGASLRVVEVSKNSDGGSQMARLNVLKDILEKTPDGFWPQQYTNPLNPESYGAIADQVISRNSKIDTIVGTVGSGGSLFGLSRALKDKMNPDLKVIAVDHNRSGIFGAEAKKITKMCRDNYISVIAIGAGIPMGNVDYKACDEVHWIPLPDMVNKVHDFHSQTGILIGPTSGAALLVAENEANIHPNKNVLTILPDHGIRYINTVFNPTWLNQWPDDLKSNPHQPTTISSLQDVTDGWSKFSWNRKSYKDITGLEKPAIRPASYNP